MKRYVVSVLLAVPGSIGPYRLPGDPTKAIAA